MIYKKLFVLAAALLLSAPAYCRIGESKEEVVKRYGEEVEVGANVNKAHVGVDELESALRASNPMNLPEPAFNAIHDVCMMMMRWKWEDGDFGLYNFNGFNIVVIFLNGKSVFETYSHGATFTQEEMDSLLAANAAGGKWEKANKPELTNGSIRAWKTIDPVTKKPSRLAVTNGGSNLYVYKPELVLYCFEAAKKMIAEAEKKKSDNVKGF